MIHGGQIATGSDLWRELLRFSNRIDALVRGSAFITQDAWCVDSSAGDDRASGSPSSPLKSISELSRRWAGKVFDPELSTVDVLLRGSFRERGVLRGTFPGGYSVVTLRGEMTERASGVISTYTPFAPASGTRANLAGTVDLSQHVGKRLRTTSGAQAGAVTFITSAAGSSGNIGQPFRLSTSASSKGVPATSNPSNGDAFVVEGFATSLSGYMLDLQGAITVLRDVRVDPLLVDPGASSRCSMSGSFYYSPTSTAFGCDFDLGARNALLGGIQSTAACRTSGTGALVFVGNNRALGLCAQGPVHATDHSHHVANACLHDGTNAYLHVAAGAVVEDQIHRAFFGVGGDYAMRLYALGHLYQIHDTGLIWGTGNTATTGVVVESGSVLEYGAVPDIGGPAQNLTVGGTVKTWGELPYIDVGAGTNQSGAMVVHRPS
jgi:hypothetical protein